MAATSRSRPQSASASPSKSNGRKQHHRVAIELSDDEEIEDRKPANKRRLSKAQQEIEIVDDDEDEDGDDDEAGEDEYEVEAVRSHRPLKGAEAWNMEYLIKWKGWRESDNTWEPESNLPQEMVNDYWKKQPSKSQPKKFEQIQKRKAAESDDGEVEEIDMDSEMEDSDEDVKVTSSKSKSASARNGRRPSGAASNRSSSAKSTPKRSSPAKRPRMSTSSRRRATSNSQEDEDEDEEDTDGLPNRSEEAVKVRAFNTIRERFLEHYLKDDNWEDRVVSILNMQRGPEDSQLESYVQFKPSDSWTRAMEKVDLDKVHGNGPRIWVSNDIVNARCPQKVIKFYEEHVRFSNPRPAH